MQTKRIELDPDGFVYRVAYAWRHGLRVPPAKTNLCPLFWRCVLSCIFVWPFVVLGFLIGLPFAARPRIYKSDRQRNNDSVLVIYDTWPTVFAEKVRVMPIVVILMIGIPSGIVFLCYEQGPRAFRWWVSIVAWLWTSHILFFILWALAALNFLGFAFVRFKKTEAYKLLLEYVKAKKNRYCPEVVFVRPKAKAEEA